MNRSSTPRLSPQGLLSLLALALTIFLIVAHLLTPLSTPPAFNAMRAYQDVTFQVELGPRVPGSQAHAALQDYILKTLQENQWSAEIQEGIIQGQRVQNIVGKRGKGNPWIILGAHYDSRMRADRDPDPAQWEQPVPGANDGASGVAVLLELARVLPPNLQKQIWLVFFDAEDQGEIANWDWILGSRFFVTQLQEQPNAVVIIDMIGDSRLTLPQERNSDPRLTAQIWNVAHSLGYEDVFLEKPGYAILDDHIPFLERGIPAVDIIDIDYAYWHTTQDLPNKVSPYSLEMVGRTLLHWLVAN